MKKKRKNYKNKGLLVSILRIIVILITGIIYFVYFIIKNFHTLIGKIFMCLPRITRVLLVYTFIFWMGISIYAGKQHQLYDYYTNPVNLFEEVQLQAKNTTEKLRKMDVVEAKVRKPESTADKVCKKYSNIECKIFKRAKKHGLADKYGYMLMAISKHETGNWTSSIFKSYHNMGGIIGSHGFRQYASLDDGIEDFVNLLDIYYINNGRNTIPSIGAKYCPVGASNDPTGLNNYWVPQVTKYYNEYTK